MYRCGKGTYATHMDVYYRTWDKRWFGDEYHSMSKSIHQIKSGCYSFYDYIYGFGKWQIKAKVNAVGGLNARKGAGTGFARVKTYPNGCTVTITEKKPRSGVGQNNRRTMDQFEVCGGVILTTEERLAVLETGQKTIFKQMDEVKGTVNEIHRLASSMEVVAAETKNISAKVDDINDRLSEVEKEPAKAFTHYKQLITVYTLSEVWGVHGDVQSCDAIRIWWVSQHDFVLVGLLILIPSGKAQLDWTIPF